MYSENTYLESASVQATVELHKTNKKHLANLFKKMQVAEV